MWESLGKRGGGCSKKKKKSLCKSIFPGTISGNIWINKGIFKRRIHHVIVQIGGIVSDDVIRTLAMMLFWMNLYLLDLDLHKTRLQPIWWSSRLPLGWSIGSFWSLPMTSIFHTLRTAKALSCYSEESKPFPYLRRSDTAGRIEHTWYSHVP